VEVCHLKFWKETFIRDPLERKASRRGRSWLHEKKKKGRRRKKDKFHRGEERGFNSTTRKHANGRKGEGKRRGTNFSGQGEGPYGQK